MSAFITLIILIIFSAGGMMFLVGSRFKEVKIMSDEELLVKLRETKHLFSDFHDYVVVPAINFWKNSALPYIYKEFEKTVSRFRINVLKIEAWLLKLTNYIRGKRKIQNNGYSEYWKDVNDSKNGDKKPE
jgi:hypothetical protein